MKNTAKTTIARLLLCSLVGAAALIEPWSNTQGWGQHGHLLSCRAAAMALPEQTPKFFRKAVDQLSYLNPEPDRWRSRDESNLDKAMDSAYAPDHFLDLELVPPAAFDAVNRYDFTAELIKAGQKPPQHEAVSKGGRGKVNPIKQAAVAAGADHGISKSTVERAIAKSEGKTPKPVAPMAMRPRTSTTATAALSLLISMAFSTPSARTATLTGVAACPAAQRLAALIVEDTTEAGTAADAML